MTKAVIINGTNSRNSRVTAIHEKVENYLKAQGIAVHTNYVHELPAEDLIKANFASEVIVSENKQVEEADIIILLTPIYKASYTGILKTYLDLLPQKALLGKIILPIAVGGSIGHLLALEYALKPVLAVLGATTIAHSVYIIDKQIIRLEDGSFAIEEEAINRLDVELTQFQQIVSI
ncbi:NADPH-dependent FMN reductase [Lysinibacillus xylanilyticus]|uniref:NADPH-dependent FMN reductase n=1 Tax=Lysinibacillus xylanilyticus TaxID=582475 RepID=UPI002B252AB2|nr:NADPH-dependent FMN reductase [Lysinibacillus xylanilyticus]MEB2278795.1 NADPH-dependent FMN reductase [Lysinibacillus xylanilyticus]